MMMLFFVFCFGALIGSFLNVCVSRLPEGGSVLKPLRSQCPTCKHVIEARDNVPIISYFFLSGKCRHCQSAISLRYPCVEFLTAVLYLVAWIYFPGFSFISVAILLSLLIVATFSDLETRLIPDEINLGGLLAGVLLSLSPANLHGANTLQEGLVQSLLGAGIGFLILYAIAVIGEFFFKKEAMGGGDIKLLAMIGAFLGWQDSTILFFIAPLLALPFALYIKFTQKESTIAYGPFLCIAAGIQLFFGDWVLQNFFPYIPI